MRISVDTRLASPGLRRPGTGSGFARSVGAEREHSRRLRGLVCPLGSKRVMVLLGFVRPNSPQRRGVAEGSHLLAETLEALAAPAWPALRIRVYPCPSVAKSLV